MYCIIYYVINKPVFVVVLVLYHCIAVVPTIMPGLAALVYGMRYADSKFYKSAVLEEAHVTEYIKAHPEKFPKYGKYESQSH